MRIPILVLLSISLMNLFAQSNLDSLERNFKNATSPNEKGAIAAEMVFDIFTKSGDLALSDKYYNYAYRYAKESGNQKILVRAVNNKGVVFYYRGVIDSALNYFSRSYDLAVRFKDHDGECRALNNLGSINYSTGKYQEALDYFRKGVRKEFEYGIEEGEYLSLNNMGYIYSHLKLYDQAKLYFIKGLRRAINHDDFNSMIFSYDGLGALYNQLRKFDSAEYYHMKVYELADKTDDVNNKMYAALNLGGLFSNLKRKKEALKFINEALSLSRKMDNDEVRASCYATYTGIYEGEPEIVSLYLDSAMSLAGKINAPSLMADFYKVKAETEFRLHHPDSAFHYAKKYADLKDSIYRLEISKSMTELQAKFDVSQKERQIDVLNERDKKKQLIIYVAIIGGLLIMCVAIYVYYVSRQRKKINLLLEKKNVEISIQKNVIEEKHKEITDSINYAERIQRSFLATKESLDEFFCSPSNGGGGDYFIVFKPKDVVSGDFYWASSVKTSDAKDDVFLFCTADSTGHGVPGAIMSLLNITSLEKAIETEYSPDKILNATRKIIIDRLKKDGSKDGGKDGMDCSLIAFNTNKSKLRIAASNNPVWIMRNTPNVMLGEVEASGSSTALGATSGSITIVEIKPDKMPVGKHDKQDTPFTLAEVELQKGDMIYTLTDGYTDQFGGSSGKKFMIKRLRELLQSICQKPMTEQKEILEQTFTDWVGDHDQIDDVTIVGMKV